MLLFRSTCLLMAAKVKQQLTTAVNERDDVVKLAREILTAASQDQDDIRKEVFLFSIDLLNSDTLINSKSKELIGQLLSEVDNLMGMTLINLADYFIEAIKTGSVANGRSLELFPKILTALMNQSFISVKRGNDIIANKMTGPDCKSHILNSLFACRWSSSCVLHIVNISRDIPLTSEELKFLIEKLFRVMKTLKVEEMPPLVYQLLLLASKGHQSLILTGIRNLFDQLDQDNMKENSEENQDDDVMEVDTNQDELLCNEGTVILHMDFALKQNQELLKEFLKSLKVTQSLFNPALYTPFTLSLVLSLTRVHRLEDILMDNLKAIIIRCFKEEDHIKSSSWMSELSEYRPIPDIEQVFLRIVHNSVSGWDLVIQGLIKLAFVLTDSCHPKNTTSMFHQSPQNRACLLGGKMLVASFKSQSVVRREVLSQLLNRILSNATTYVDHYISILAELTRSLPQVVMEEGAQLKETFVYIMCIPATPAVALIQAVLPLVQFRATYRDALLLALRKSLFSRDIECRKSAVGGYLLLLKNFKVLDSFSTSTQEGEMNLSQFAYSSQSQTLAEVHTSYGTRGMSSNEALCLEILGTLRRCLSQQCDVKIFLYEGIPDVLITNAKLAEPVMEFLLNQFNKYYEPDEDIVPPVKLSPCLVNIGSGFVKEEPLSKLVCCIQACTKQCIEWVEKGVESVTSLDKMKSVLSSLSQRLSTTDLEDFELDKSGDYSSSTSVGIKNSITAQIILSLYETLMDYTFATGKYSQDACQLTLKLYTKYQSIVDMLQEKGGGAGRRVSTKIPTSLLSISSLVLFLKSLFSDTLPSHQLPLSILRESMQFVRYVINTTLVKLRETKEETSPWCWGSKTQCKVSQRNYEHICVISKILFDQLDGSTVQTTGKKDKLKSIPSLCLEVFSQALHVVTTCYTNQFVSFLTGITRTEESGSNEQVHYYIRHFQHLVVAIINGSLKDYILKDVHIIINIISILTEHLDRDSSQYLQVLEWTDAQCQEHNIDDLTIVRDLVSLLLTLHYRRKGSIKILRKLSQDIHIHVGDIDQDVELSGHNYYAIVNPRTASGAVLGVLSSQLDTLLNDGEVIMNFIKFEFETDNSSVNEDMYNTLCERLHSVVLTFHELVQTALPQGNVSDTVLKNLAKLYSLLSDVAKYQSLLHNQMSVLQPNFKKLTEMVGSHLSQQVYYLISYIQNTQMAMLEQDHSKKGKGKSKLPGKAQVKREKKCIPNLIYWMEQFENILIKLSKKSKNDLMTTFKRSVARDFRIKDSTLDALLKEQEEEDMQDEQDDDDDDCCVTGEEGPRPKKLKT